MHVEETRAPAVDRCAEVFVRLVGRAPCDRLGKGEFAVERLAGRGPRDDADLERPSGLVFGLGALGKGGGNRLRGPRGREPAETDCVVVVDECCRFLRGHEFFPECHG